MRRDVRLGAKKEEVAHCVVAGTFHPFKDEWYVVATSEGQPCYATFIDGVCTDILVYKTMQEANDRLIKEYHRSIF